MPVRALYFDLDGTLLDHDHAVPLALAQAIARARARGLKIGIATGRRKTTTLPYALQIETNAPLILFNGAVVVDADREAVLFHAALPHEETRAVVDAVLAAGVHVCAYVDEDLYVDPSHPRPQLMGPAGAVLLSPTERPLRTLPVAPTKLLFVDEPARLVALRADLTARGLVPPGAHLVRSNPRFLELLPDGVSKGRALPLVAARLGVDVDDIAAFGDDENDADMLAAAGTGVAMAHAPESVRARAARVTPREELPAVVDELTR
jgi:Cof subfamily protein (haloacid dehalogenase superfamily)